MPMATHLGRRYVLQQGKALTWVGVVDPLKTSWDVLVDNDYSAVQRVQPQEHEVSLVHEGEIGWG